MTEKKLIESGSEPQDTKELHDRMSELQSEMFRLEISNKKLNNYLKANGTTADVNGIKSTTDDDLSTDAALSSK